MKPKKVRRIAAALFGITALVLPAASAQADTVSDEAAFVNAINISRAAAGLKPLGVHPELVEVARSWSGVMAKNSDEAQAQDEYGRFKCTIVHTDALGATMKTQWLDIGENVGCADATPDEIHQAFMDSPKHRANILDPDYNYVGIGIVRANNVNYVTEQFMRFDGKVGTVTTTATEAKAADGGPAILALTKSAKPTTPKKAAKAPAKKKK